MKKGKIIKKKLQRKNKKNSFLWSKLFLGVVFVLVLLLACLFFVQFVNFDKINFFEKHVEKRVVIVDECSPLQQYGLIHQIRDEADCSNNCVSACMVRGLEKVRIEFEAFNNTCNNCICYCK